MARYGTVAKARGVVAMHQRGEPGPSGTLKNRTKPDIRRPAAWPGVRLGGGPAVCVVKSVVEVGSAGRAAAAHIYTRPISDLDMAAQHHPGEPGGRGLSARGAPATLGVLGGDVGSQALFINHGVTWQGVTWTAIPESSAP